MKKTITKLAHELAHLPEPLQKNTRCNLENFFAELEKKSLSSPVEDEFLKHLVRVFAVSQFVTDYALQNPEAILNLYRSKELFTELNYSFYKNKFQQLLYSEDTESILMQKLRSARKEAFVRIAMRDILGLTTLSETVTDLSNFADCCIDSAAQWFYEKLARLHGVPVNDRNIKQDLLIIAVGKLGMRELNFSSDVDLIFCYPSTGMTNGENAISNERFFTLQAQRLTQILNNYTECGFVFRIDLRLRPYGTQGALVITFDSLQNYYRQAGREWERFALAKARVVSGDYRRDDLLQIIHEFVYRPYLDFSVVEVLRNMQTMIRREITTSEENIKRGLGGIREIEFIFQVFQLIHGGRHAWLKETGLLKTLPQLVEHDLLDENIVADLYQGYEFLRTIEHRLQEYADQQTQLLPAKDLEKNRLAYAMNEKNYEDLYAKIIAVRHKIHAHFESIVLMPAKTPPKLAVIGDKELIKTFLDEDEQASLTLLISLGYTEPEEILNAIKTFIKHIKPGDFSQEQKFLQEIFIRILTLSASYQTPKTLVEKLLRLLDKLLELPIYLKLLYQYPAVLMQVVELFSKSNLVSEMIVQCPFLLDEFVNAKTLFSPYPETKLQDELRQSLLAIPEQELEAQMECLRDFKLVQVLRVAAADLAATLPLMKVSDHLTFTATVIVRYAKTIAWQSLVNEAGFPVNELQQKLSPDDFVIIAYGKLGGIELSYDSDLDLVFFFADLPTSLMTDGAKPISNLEFFIRLAQRIIYILTVNTRHGYLYKVDTRLRPSGASGLLAQSFTAFANYQRTKAWTWEHQALVRARVISGSKKLCHEFERLRAEIIGRKRDTEKLKAEVKQMREKMLTKVSGLPEHQFDIKHSLGGIGTIEFIVQHYALNYGHYHPSLYEYTDNIRILEAMSKEALLGERDAEFLSKVYRTYRRMVHHASLYKTSVIVEKGLFVEERRFVEAMWEQLFGC